jgi:hypothetical protein
MKILRHRINAKESASALAWVVVAGREPHVKADVVLKDVEAWSLFSQSLKFQNKVFLS